MWRHKPYDYSLSFIDLLFNMMSAMTILFVLAITMITPAKKNGDVDLDAQYVVKITWDPSVDCDVDLWVRDPQGKISFFKQKDVGLGHLERDDLGKGNDTYLVQGGKSVYVTQNDEVWVARGTIIGTYTANVHLYACNNAEGRKLPVGTVADVKVHMEVQRVNPILQLIGIKDIVLRNTWDEEYGLEWDITDASGDWTGMRDSSRLMVKDYLKPGQSGGN